MATQARTTAGVRGCCNSPWTAGGSTTAQTLPTTSLATARSGLLAGHGQIGFNLDRVGEFEDQQLGDLHAMVGEGGCELRPDPEIVGGEAKRFCVSSCSGVSFTYVMRASAVMSMGWRRMVR